MLQLAALARGNAGLAAVLSVGDVLEPIDDLAVFLLLDGDVAHTRGGGGTVPVLFAGGEPDHVAGADFFHGATMVLRPAVAAGDDERLAEGVRVPCGASAGFEGNVCAL